MTENSNQELISILKNFKDHHVAVIGDVMLDRFVYGQVKRISPESPVPVLNVKRADYMLGGAGNVLSNLNGLDVKVSLCGVIGNDTEGDIVQGLISEKNQDHEWLVVEQDRPTTVKTRFLSGNQQLLRVDDERTDHVSPAIAQNILDNFIALSTQVQAVILSDYGKGVFNRGMLAQIIKVANDLSIPVLVDPKGSDYTRYSGASVVTPNLNELEQAVGREFSRDDLGVIGAAEELIGNTSIHAVLATRSQDGMSVVESDLENGGFKTPVHFKNRTLEVFDVSGAGDTVIATLAAGLATGASLKDSVHIANYAGGVVVGKVGTSPIRIAELEAALSAGDGHDTARGISNGNDRPGSVPEWDEAKEFIQKWKRRGLRVGFTNGCFDILHQGHTQYLAAARDNCDRLIVGLNCDSSVSRLKGADRPVNPEGGRAAVLAALSSVDMVVLFGAGEEENDMPIDLIRALQPDVIFKGGDYKEEDLPEAAVVRSYGGDVMLMSFVDGVSTTQTIEKIKQKSA